MQPTVFCYLTIAHFVIVNAVGQQHSLKLLNLLCMCMWG